MYDPSNQYRCTIIRGKSQKDMDNLLPAYAQIISEICPCEKTVFSREFNTKLAEILGGETTKKTLDNHRTEVAGKLFGMYYEAPTGYEDEVYVYPGERTMKFLADQDQPAFFKDVCFKMQFPDGTTKFSTIAERVELGISIRQCCYLIEVLMEAQRMGIRLSKNDAGYYVLNSLDALKREASPFEIVDAIIKERNKGITSHTIGDPSKASSYNVQHINEQLNYLELANLIIIDDDGMISLNPNEQTAIDIFSSHWDDAPMFDVSEYDTDTPSAKQYFQTSWDQYYSTLSSDAGRFSTSITALISQSETSTDSGTSDGSLSVGGQDTVELGDEGERYVYEYEKQRVAQFNPRLANKVLSMGKTKGLGYDIQTVVAEPGDQTEFVRYIEVKATKRVTAPDLNDSQWLDTVNITRNEWIAAQQHGAYYSIYRVYFVRGQVYMYVIDNPFKLFEDDVLFITPTMYKMDFGSNAVKRVINIQ